MQLSTSTLNPLACTVKPSLPPLPVIRPWAGTRDATRAVAQARDLAMTCSRW